MAESSGATRLRFIQKKYVDRRYYRSKVHHQFVSKDFAQGTPSRSASNGSLTRFIASKASSGDGGTADKSVFSGSGKHSVGTTSTSTSSLDHNGERTKKNNDYRDPRRAEFMNSRSSLNFSMEDIDADIQRTKSTKKAPMAIKIAKASTPTNSRMALYQSASKAAKPRERRDRGRSSSAQRSGREASPAHKADQTLTDTMRGLGDRSDSGRSLGSSVTSRRSRGNGDRGRSRSSSLARRHPTTRRPSSDARHDPNVHNSSSISLPTRSRGRQGLSGMKNNKEMDESQRTSSSERRSRSRGSSRRSISRARVSGDTHQRSASSNRGGTEEAGSAGPKSHGRTRTEDRDKNGRSRSTSRIPNDDRLSRKAGEAAIRQAASRRAARERSRSRSRARKDDPKRDSGDHESLAGEEIEKAIAPSTDRRDSLRIRMEIPRRRAVDGQPLPIDSSHKSKGGNAVIDQKGGHRHDKMAHNSFPGLDASETKHSKGNRSFNSLTDIDGSNTTVHPSLSKRSNSFVGLSKSRSDDPWLSGGEGKEPKDSVALKTSKLKDDEDGFAVISTTHKPLDTFQAHFKKSRDESIPWMDNSFGAGSHCRSLSTDNGGRNTGLALRSTHSEGDSFQRTKLRMSKTQATEMSARRASRKSSILASLNAEEDQLKAGVPPMTQHSLHVRSRDGFSYGTKRAMSEGPVGALDQKLGTPLSSLNKPSSSMQPSGGVSASGADGNYEGRNPSMEGGSRLHRIPIRRSHSDIAISPGTSHQPLTRRVSSTTERDFQKGIERLERSRGTGFASNPSGPGVRRQSRPANDPVKRRSTSRAQCTLQDSSAVRADEDTGMQSQPMRLSDFDASFATLDFTP